jgi:methylmalonyl-CoA mutase cobalamin-binding domain/chain
MESKKIFEKIKNAVIEFKEEDLKELVQRAIDESIPVEKIIDTLSEGMNIIGEKYQSGEYFVTELIIAGETMKVAMEVVQPHMETEGGDERGIIVLATVAGDIHDIGKNILKILLTSAGFKVVDLGVDVSTEDILKAVKEHEPNILGLSALLTTNLEQFPKVVSQLKTSGIREKVKVIIGGAVVTEEFALEAGVDAYAKTAIEGVNICKKWAKEESPSRVRD